MGFLGNLLIVPLTGCLPIPVGLAAAVWSLVSDGSLLPGQDLLQWLGTLLVEIARTVARGPGAEWHVASPPVYGMLAYYMLLGLVCWPGTPRVLRGVALVPLVLLVLLALWSPRSWQTGELRLTFLDVGQGDACVIELLDGRTVVVD